MTINDPILDAMHKLATSAAEVLSLADVDPDHPEDFGETLTPIADAGRAAVAVIVERLDEHRRTMLRDFDAAGFTPFTTSMAGNEVLSDRDMVYPDSRKAAHV